MPRQAQVKKTTPVRSTRQFVESEDHPVPQARARNLPAHGKARLDPPEILVAERTVSQEKLAALAFNEEVLTVLVHDSTNPTDEQIVEVWNGNIPQRFIRGMEQEVKRKFVEVLARAKITTYTQRKLPNNEGYANDEHTVRKYPFTVTRDPNPRGAAWLKSILASA